AGGVERVGVARRRAGVPGGVGGASSERVVAVGQAGEVVALGAGARGERAHDACGTIESALHGRPGLRREGPVGRAIVVGTGRTRGDGDVGPGGVEGVRIVGVRTRVAHGV